MKKRLFFLLYDIVLHVLFIAYIPVIIKKTVFNSKYRNIFDRIGFGKIRKLRVDRSKAVIWLHSASVGEVLLVRPIIDLIKKKNPNSFLLVTCSSESGCVIARKILNHIDYVAYLPLDVSYLIKPVVKRIKPDLVVISENDVWLNFVNTCKDMNSKLVVINGKLSDKSFNNFFKFKYLAKLLFNGLDLICLQDEGHKKKFLSLNIDDKKLIVTGNIKAAFIGSKLSEVELEQQKKDLGLIEGDLVFTLGSTHEGEEAMWVDILDKLIQQEPRLKLIIVPRHVNRVEQIEKMLIKKGLTYGVWGEKNVFKEHNILLVNVMGELCNIYQMSDYAFVGGTFKEKVGGHNLLEPIFYNIPLFFGPYTFSQSRIAHLIIEKRCGISLSADNFDTTMVEALKNKELLSSVVHNGAILLKEENSSLSKTWEEISNFIPC